MTALLLSAYCHGYSDTSLVIGLPTCLGVLAAVIELTACLAGGV